MSMLRAFHLFVIYKLSTSIRNTERKRPFSGHQQNGGMTTVSSQVSTYASANPSIPILPQTGFNRQAQVLTFIPFSKSTLWRQVAAGVFPAPVKLAPSITAWRAEDIRTWIESRGVAAQLRAAGSALGMRLRQRWPRAVVGKSHDRYDPPMQQLPTPEEIAEADVRRAAFVSAIPAAVSRAEDELPKVVRRMNAAARSKLQRIYQVADALSARCRSHGFCQSGQLFAGQPAALGLLGATGVEGAEAMDRVQLDPLALNGEVEHPVQIAPGIVCDRRCAGGHDPSEDIVDVDGGGSRRREAAR